MGIGRKGKILSPSTTFPRSSKQLLGGANSLAFVKTTHNPKMFCISASLAFTKAPDELYGT